VFPCFSWCFFFLSFILLFLSLSQALLCLLLFASYTRYWFPMRGCAARNKAAEIKAVSVRRLRHGLEFFDVIDFFFLLTGFALAQLFGSWFVIGWVDSFVGSLIGVVYRQPD